MTNTLATYIEAARNARRVRDSALEELNAVCDAARTEYSEKIKTAYDAEDVAYLAVIAEYDQAAMDAPPKGD